MPKEIEKRFFKFDEARLKEQIIALGGVRKGIFHFKVINFKPPASLDRLRLREEGFRITFTIKKKGADGYDEENEVIVNNFEEMETILTKLGYEKKDYFHKIREIYNIGDCELIFDHLPGLVPYVEIEAPSEGELFSLSDRLGLDKTEGKKGMGDLYREVYGVEKSLDITFMNAVDLIMPYIEKSKELKEKFWEIITQQNELLKRVDNAKGASPSGSNSSSGHSLIGGNNTYYAKYLKYRSKYLSLKSSIV